MKNYSKGALQSANKKLIVVVAIALVVIICAGVILGVGFGLYGTDASKWFKNPAQANTQKPTTTNLDDIKPVDKLTAEDWITAWVIDPSKAVDTAKFDVLRGSHDAVEVIEPIDFNTLNFSGDLCGRYGDPAFGTLAATDGAVYLVTHQGEGFINNMYVYIEKGSAISLELGGGHGWGKINYFGFEPITEKVLFELPVEMRYDTANYDLVKDFMTPVLATNFERVQPVPFEENRPIKGFKLKDCYLDISDSNIHVDDVLLEGTIVDNPMGIDDITTVKVCFYTDSYDLQFKLQAGAVIDERSLGSKGDLDDGSLITEISFNHTSDLLFSNGAVYSFADTSAYEEQKLWRFLEPIYAEKATDSTEAKVVGYSIDFDKIGYVALDSDYSKDSFEVYSQTLSIGELSVESIYVYCAKGYMGQHSSSMRHYYISAEDIAKIQEQMTAENYEGTLDEYISGNNTLDYHAPIGEPYGVGKYAYGDSYDDASLTAFVEWLNANGFEEAVTTIYSQYK